MSRREKRQPLSLVAAGVIAAGCTQVPAVGTLTGPGVLRGAANDLGANTSRAPAGKTDLIQGRIQGTGKPTDLAIQGDGFFVLSRGGTPREVSDFRFTRSGGFHFAFQEEPVLPSGLLGQGAVKGTYRLVNEEGLAVMGLVSGEAEAYELNAIPNLPGRPNAPKEFLAFSPDFQAGPILRQRSTGFLSPTPKEVVDGYQLAAIEIPYQIDPAPLGGIGKTLNSNFAPTFDSRGYVQFNYDAPSADVDNAMAKLVLFVAIARLKDPSSLVESEFAKSYSWSDGAGDVLLGISGQDGTVIGNSNTILPASLEVVD